MDVFIQSFTVICSFDCSFKCLLIEEFKGKLLEGKNVFLTIEISKFILAHH